MPTVRANGIDLKVNRFRSGGPGPRPTLVCVHGLGIVDHSSLAFTLGMPLATSADVVLYDLRGHGRSQVPPTGYSMGEQVGDLLALLEALDVATPVHLLGGSFGGAIAVTAAALRPDAVASLSLIDAQVPVPGWGDHLAEPLELAADGLRGDYTTQQIMDVVNVSSARRAAALAKRASKLLLETSLLADLRAEPGLAPADYARIACPVLGLFGDESPILPVASRLREILPAAEIRILPGANHYQVFGRHETRDGIRRFITRIEAERAGDPSILALGDAADPVPVAADGWG
ncbi:MAG TPA: alpha/beta hydrolase [Acidimicrobiales bacterium]|nr:alpha/beta hydrolase [Acidimicrobiales bacterium]